MPPDSYSQYGQDKLIAKLFGHKRGGTFIEIGAFDGETLSNTALLERQYGWRGICIEPSPEPFRKLKASRGCICVNAAAGAAPGQLQFEAIDGYGAMLSGATATRPKPHDARIENEQREHGFERRIIVVDVVRAADLLARHGITVVDFASVDVEGAELAALEGLLSPDLTVRALAVENNYGEPDVPRLLRDRGYVRLTVAGEDDVWRLRRECGLAEWALRLFAAPQRLRRDRKRRRRAKRLG